MKDTFTQKVQAISSCLADCTVPSVESISEEGQDKQTLQDNYGRVRRSAAMIGLAISMSATGMVLAQSKAVMAADTIPANPSIPSLPASSEADQVSSLSQENQLTPLALHKVQPGESIGQLAQEYRVEPQAIANSNQMSVTTALVPGQTIRIPAVEKSAAPVRQIVANVPQSEAIASKPLNTSLDHLRETRKRLQDSLAELKTEKSNPHLESPSNVSDVSQSLKPVEVAPQDRTVVAQNIVTEAIEIPVYPAETEKRVISRPSSRVQLPTTVTKSSESNLRTNASSVAPSEVQESSSITSSLPKLPSVPSANSQKTARAFEQPISIPVVPAQAPINSAESSAFNTSPSPQEIDVNSEPSSFRQPAVIRQPRVIAPVSQKFYQIKPGDTLNSIARRHGLSSAELIRANGITNPNKIKVYQSLVIPQPGSFAQAQPTRSRLAPLGRPLSSFNAVSEAQTSRFEDNRLPQQQTNPMEISVSAAPESYTEKLKTDMANLQQDYGQKPQSIPIEVNPDVQANASDTVVGESLNPEWDSDRQRQSTFAQPNRRSSRQLRSAPPQIISTAPSDTQDYNEAFQIPVGTNVGPELPSLSSPDNYFPNGPTQFTGYMWPAKGVLTSGYGRRWGRMHKGIDIAAPIGTPVMAAASGEVISAGWNSGGYGNLVKIRHADGSITFYAHNSRVLVRPGQIVQQGEQISLMGSTGRSTGPHLHFEVHPGGSGAVNPIAFLPKDRGS